MAAGTTTITFTIRRNGCQATATFTVSARAIDYFDDVGGRSLTLLAGGTWSASAGSIATTSSTSTSSTAVYTSSVVVRHQW